MLFGQTRKINWGKTAVQEDAENNIKKYNKAHKYSLLSEYYVYSTKKRIK